MGYICSKCDGFITEGKIILALEKKWHEKCFVCTEEGCTTVLGEDNPFYEFEGNPYCETHISQFYQQGSTEVQECSVCNKPIEGVALNAFDRSYHDTCFQCFSCKKQLEPNDFYADDNQPYCEPCLRKKKGL